METVDHDNLGRPDADALPELKKLIDNFVERDSCLKAPAPRGEVGTSSRLRRLASRMALEVAAAAVEAHERRVSELGTEGVKAPPSPASEHLRKLRRWLDGGEADR